MPDPTSPARASGGPADPPHQRGPRWAEGRPYAALLFCLTLFALQVATWMLLFVVLMSVSMPKPLFDVLVAALKWAMLLIPLGSAYGLYLGTRTPPAEHARVPHVLGILANGGYLAFGIYLWLMMLMDAAA